MYKYKSEGFSILHAVIIVPLIVIPLFYIELLDMRRIEEQWEERREIGIRWRQKTAEERGIIIRDSLIRQTEEISKNIVDLDSQLVSVELTPTLTEKAIRNFTHNFSLLAKHITEAEIMRCCAKELEQYLKVYHIIGGNIQRNHHNIYHVNFGIFLDVIINLLTP